MADLNISIVNKKVVISISKPGEAWKATFHANSEVARKIAQELEKLADTVERDNNEM